MHFLLDDINQLRVAFSRDAVSAIILQMWCFASRTVFCCDWMHEEELVLGCLSLEEIKNLKISKELFIWLSCSVRIQIPFKVRNPS